VSLKNSIAKIKIGSLMPRVGLTELVTLSRVVASGQLLRYRGGETGFHNGDSKPNLPLS